VAFLCMNGCCNLGIEARSPTTCNPPVVFDEFIFLLYGEVLTAVWGRWSCTILTIVGALMSWFSLETTLKPVWLFFRSWIFWRRISVYFYCFCLGETGTAPSHFWGSSKLFILTVLDMGDMNWVRSSATDATVVFAPLIFWAWSLSYSATLLTGRA
jgi:hypothetical protein